MITFFKGDNMKKVILLVLVAFNMCGCYTYTTTRTIKADGKECSFNVMKRGNGLAGYTETDFTNAKRSEQDCNEWLNVK